MGQWGYRLMASSHREHGQDSLVFIAANIMNRLWEYTSMCHQERHSSVRLIATGYFVPQLSVLMVIVRDAVNRDTSCKFRVNVCSHAGEQRWQIVPCRLLQFC